MGDRRLLLQMRESGGGRAGLIRHRRKWNDLLVSGEENAAIEPRMAHASRFKEAAALGQARWDNKMP